MSKSSEIQLTYENLYADYESARDAGKYDQAREIIKAMQRYSAEEAVRMEKEIDELDV